MPDLGYKNLVFLGDEVLEDPPGPNFLPSNINKESPPDTDTDDDEDAISPVQKKRKRTTNNSFALDLENNFDEEVIIPPPAKRFQFTPNQEKGIFIGVWKLSPEPIDAKKHAVYAFIDAALKLRSRVWPETKTGEELLQGYPSGPGQSMIAPNNIIYESHLACLTRPQIKEYVRIRSLAPDDESPDEQRRAEEKATAKAIGMAGNEDVQPSRTPAATPIKAAKVTSLNGLKRPRGILLGYWKDSWIANEANKHSVYGVLQDDERLRVKVVRETRDGRPINEPFSSSVWIPYEQVVLEPHLVNLLRTEVREYVRFRQSDLSSGQPERDRKVVEEEAVRRAKAKILANTQATDIGVAQYDASINAGRIAKNEAMAALKEIEVTPNPTSFKPPTPKTRAESSSADGGTQAPSAPSVNKRKEPEPVTKMGGAELITNMGSPEHKGKAVRSSKADSDARAERLRRERGNKEAENKGDKPRKESAEDFRSRLFLDSPLGHSEKVRPQEATKARAYGDESRKVDSTGPDMQRREERHKVRDPQQQQRKSFSASIEPQGDIKRHGGVTYELKDSGPFEDKYVGDRRELLVIDGEDYIEYRVIMKVQF